MTHVSLFSGIGGLDLAAEWAGFKTILQVEMDDYANRVLEKHWPDVPRVRDIRDVTRDSISGPVTVISGGFPCQPFSQAGKRGGREDDRYLWPEMLRVIRELSPAWIVGENVSGLLSINDGMEIESIMSQMEDEGYEVLPLLYPATGVCAPHKRDRVFIVANSASERFKQGAISRRTLSTEAWGPEPHKRSEPPPAGEWWTVEPDVGRVAHGIPSRVDRLKCLGNAVVPAQAYPIFKAIAEMENR